MRRAARFGAVGLALVCLLWLMDPIPTSLNTKSNVATAAAAVRPLLGRDPLVLSTQPEQVPVLHYYLPAARRYLTPLGAVPDPGIVDWRNALTRFDALDPAAGAGSGHRRPGARAVGRARAARRHPDASRSGHG